MPHLFVHIDKCTRHILVFVPVVTAFGKSGEFISNSVAST